MKRIHLLITAVVLLRLAGIAQADVFNLGSGLTNLETVMVGDACNAADTTGYGSVAYDYNIGKYEVTAGQYTAFLNAVASTDTYALYNTNMSDTRDGCGISRGGASGSYTYSVEASFANRPVNYVSWGDAARFANWLQNGQKAGTQDSSTTEDGAYSLNGATTSAALNAIARNTGWTWAITSEDEWYKAAYYDPNKTGGAGYWMYPTGSNAPPGRDMTDASGKNANYWWVSGDYPIDSGKYTTVVGAFENSDSPYGTFDQGGNVYEWNEAIIGDAYRSQRGGSWGNGSGNLQASTRRAYDPSDESNDIGFRLSEVPEPTSIIALLSGLAGCLGLRRRKG